MAKPTGKPAGRPTKYSQQLANEICAQLAKGRSLRHICLSEDMPDAATVHMWVLTDREGFHKQYARAREIQAEVMFDEILEISDDGSNDYMTKIVGNQEYETENKEVTNRSRLRVDSRKWYLSKVLPKKFGDKLDLTSDNKQLPVPLLYGIKPKDESGNFPEIV